MRYTETKNGKKIVIEVVFNSDTEIIKGTHAYTHDEISRAIKVHRIIGTVEDGNVFSATARTMEQVLQAVQTAKEECYRMTDFPVDETKPIKSKLSELGFK